MLKINKSIINTNLFPVPSTSLGAPLVAIYARGHIGSLFSKIVSLCLRTYRKLRFLYGKISSKMAAEVAAPFNISSLFNNILHLGNYWLKLQRTKYVQNTFLHKQMLYYYKSVHSSLRLCL